MIFFSQKVSYLNKYNCVNVVSCYSTLIKDTEKL